ncbi:MAG: hypothetical protein WC974_02215 [Thermoplasmata archaeon]
MELESWHKAAITSGVIIALIAVALTTPWWHWEIENKSSNKTIVEFTFTGVTTKSVGNTSDKNRDTSTSWDSLTKTSPQIIPLKNVFMIDYTIVVISLMMGIVSLVAIVFSGIKGYGLGWIYMFCIFAIAILIIAPLYMFFAAPMAEKQAMSSPDVEGDSPAKSFIGSTEVEGGKISWYPGIGWILAIVAVVVLAIMVFTIVNEMSFETREIVSFDSKKAIAAVFISIMILAPVVNIGLNAPLAEKNAGEAQQTTKVYVVTWSETQGKNYSMDGEDDDRASYTVSPNSTCVVGTVTFTLTWTDDWEYLEKNKDKLHLKVTGPTGEGSEHEDTTGSITLSIKVADKPPTTNVNATSTDDARSIAISKYQSTKGMGTWFGDVTVTPEGVADNGNDWQIEAKYTYYYISAVTLKT